MNTAAMRILRLHHPISLVTTILLLSLLLAFLHFLNYGWRVICFPYPVDYGEGPLLDQTLRLSRFRNIYRPDVSTPPYTIANYPPVYLLLQTPFVWVFGPVLRYGRIVSWLSIAATAICLGFTLHTLTHDRLAAIITSFIFLAIPYVSYWAPFYRVDALALGLSWGALCIIVHRPQARWSLLLTAFLLICALYTRQSYGLAAPLTAFIWLLSHRPRRRVWWFVAIVAGSSLSVFVLLNVITDGGFFFNIVIANLNEFRLGRLRNFWAGVLIFLPCLLLFSGHFLIRGRWRQPLWRFVVPYFVGATLSALTIGKVGSNINYFLEFSAALSLTTGAFLAWQQRQKSGLRQIFMFILTLQVVILIGSSRLHHRSVTSRIECRAEYETLIRIVRQAEGLVLTDEWMGLLPGSGHPIYLQPFEFTQLAYQRRWDQRPLLHAIQQQQFALILIYKTFFSPFYRDRWTPEMLAQIERCYAITERIGKTLVYRPKYPACQ